MSLSQADSLAQPGAIRLAALKAEIWLHARLMPAWASRWSFDAALQYAHAQPQMRFAGLSAEKIARWVLRTTRKPWMMRERRCLRQGLLGARFMRLAGHPCELHFAIDANSLQAPKLAAHCWVVLDGEPILNTIGDNMVLIHVDRSEDLAS